MRSIYVIGGAGSGKSTFMEALLDKLNLFVGPLTDLHSLRNKKALVTLRGHELKTEWGAGPTGMYLGVMRDLFPGSDGLDRASSPVGEDWLKQGPALDFIVGEGATLATRRFLYALDETTSMLLVHLHVDPVVADLRFLQRGSAQNDSFVTNTVTRSMNLLVDMRSRGCLSTSVDTDDRTQWNEALESCRKFLL